MTDTYEPQEPDSGWTPPPPPSDWASQGWRDPSAWAAPTTGPAEPADPGRGDGGTQQPGGQQPGPYQGGPYQGGPYRGGPYQGGPYQGGPYQGGAHPNDPYGWYGQQPGWGTPGMGGPGMGGPGMGRPGGGWYGWSPGRPRRSLPSAVTALLLVVAVLVGLGIGHGVWVRTHVSAPSSSGNGFDPFGNGAFGGGTGGSGTGNGSGSSNSGSLSAPIAKAADALVDIDTTLSYQNGEAAGTGIVLTANGYILTNNHVISGATSIKATDIATGDTFTGTVVGYDRIHDVAVIKLQGASGLQTASIGNSARVSVGTTVVGLGNAGGVGGTPSSAPGQVTALDQSITAQDESNGTAEKLTGLIQTNADIQPGDSGGALVDSTGQVVGMDTAASTGFSFANPGNQGFAIPINQAMSIASQIRSGQASASVHIGATAFLGVEVDTSQQAAATKGAVIQSAIPNGAAAAAGIGGGDVITSLGGSPVDSATALTNLIGRYHPGDKVPVAWTDQNGQTHQATVTLANGPAA